LNFEQNPDLLWLSLAAFLAGSINALAGGGTLLTFPALLEILAPKYDVLAGIFANGTSTVPLVPGSLGSSWGFRRELYPLRRPLFWLTPPSLIGGGLGAWLLVRYPRQFNVLIPWLILTAAVLFTLQPFLSRWLKRAPVNIKNHPPADTRVSTRALIGMILLQLVIAIYGGYFGAGIGILMLSGLGLMGLTDIHQMNGLKVILAAAINAIAVVIFVCRGNVEWSLALVMMVASLLGGFLAAHYSRRIDGRYVRSLVIAIGFSLAAWYFWKTYSSVL
jgi:uncharacterized membrane protein YfcA